MAVTSRRVNGGELGNDWFCLAIGPESHITDTFIQNAGDQDAYISVDKNWGNYILLKSGQSLAFDGLSWVDISKLWVTDDGNGTTIGILSISR